MISMWDFEQIKVVNMAKCNLSNHIALSKSCLVFLKSETFRGVVIDRRDILCQTNKLHKTLGWQRLHFKKNKKSICYLEIICHLF